MAEMEVVNEVLPFLTDQLRILYPNGPSSQDEEALSTSLGEMLKSNGAEFADLEAWLVALPMAIQNWKASTPVNEVENTKPKSFSLFDQFLQLQPPVTFDEIEEAPSSEARLALCQKIDYLDDMFLEDWSKTRPMLSSELIENKPTKIGFLKLHRKLYDLARKSSEFIVIQYELCHNLFDGIIASMQDLTKDPDYLFSLMRSWCDIFLDIMQRDSYSPDFVLGMEVKMLMLLRDTSQSLSNRSETVEISSTHLLALADDQARWFQSWVQATSLENILSLAEETSFLADVITHCSIPVPANRSTDISIMGQFALYKQSVIVLACLLEKARVARFPWHFFCKQRSSLFNTADLEKDIAKPFANKSMPTNSALVNNKNIDKVIGIFTEAISLDDSLRWTRICINALEVVATGCKSTEDIDRYVEMISSTIDASHETARRCWEIVTCRLR